MKDKNLLQQIVTAITTPGQELNVPVKIPIDLAPDTKRLILTAAGLLATSLIIAAFLNRRK